MKLLVLSGLALLCVNPTSPQELLSARRAVSKVEIVKPSGAFIDTLTLQVGDTGSVACKVTNQYGSVLKRSCSWVALTTTRATVSPASGEATTVRGVGSGTTRVIASTASKADTVWVVVTDGTIPPPPGSGVPIAVGDNLQAKIDANPAGTAFRILAGTHVNATVVPKASDSLLCEPGAIMDGSNTVPHAIKEGGSPYPDNVVIRGCEVKRYNPPSQLAAIRMNSFSATGAKGWIIENNHIHDNANVGLRLGPKAVDRFNNIHDNAALGVSGIGDSILVYGDTIHHNNPTGANLGFEAGGTKFVLGRGLILRKNYVHHNKGPGLWLDIDNIDFVIDSNTSDDNLQEGIAVEISYGGVVKNNTARRNGLDDTRASSWPWGAGIIIAASGGTGIEVSGNRLEGNAHGISLIQQNRGSGAYGPYLVQNVDIHDNIITLQTIAGHLLPASIGSIQAADDYQGGLWTGRNITIDNNTFTLNGKQWPFHWQGYKSFAQWQGVGFDLNSTATP